MAASKQAQSRATTKYIKTHMRQYVVRFQKESEADMIAWLNNTGNVTQTIKRLIREQMRREQQASGDAISVENDSDKPL